jgi:aspartate-semialdehyde dehydrogenase
MQSFKVGILGATGAVGQKFARLLQGHPWFNIAALGASERSAGKLYRDAVNWIESTELPDHVGKMTVTECQPGAMGGVDFVFSGLDASVATEIEQAFAEAGIPVISNAKNFRTHPDVPLLVPEVNPDHIELIRRQSFSKHATGFIVTNPNCVCVPLVMALRPLIDSFGIDAVVMTSMQSVSGAGYPGVPSLDILGNIVPFIGGEEDKIMSEPLKLLGTREPDGSIRHAGFPIQATAVRVPVIEGHLLSVAVKLTNRPAKLADVREAILAWKNPLAAMNLPFSPEHALKLYDDPRFPQPGRHSEAGNGMQVSMGRLREGSVFDLSFIALGHNTVRGAAGGAILNAELLVNEGYL